MNKRSRFLLLIAVLAVCFVFLTPSLSWYYLTPKEVQSLALSSLENIKEYATVQAEKDVEALKNAVKKEDVALLSFDANYSWLEKKVRKIMKKDGRKKDGEVRLSDVLSAYPNERAMTDDVQSYYREKILKAKKNYQNSVKLGLDLNGGMSIVVKADLEAALKNQEGSVAADNADEFKKNAMKQALSTLSSRIDRFGLTEPVIRQQGEDRIYIEMPGAAEADAINTIIMGRGVLNFRLVDGEANERFAAYYSEHASEAFDARGNFLHPEIIGEDSEILGHYTKDEYGLDERIGYLVVKRKAVLDGKHIKSASVGSDNLTNKPEVYFTLDSEGAEIFAKFTAENKGKHLAIVSDGKIKSYATIRDVITGGRVSISGFSLEEAKNLQKVLESAWLTVPLSVESQQVIGASLGEELINRGIKAVVIGLVSILVFMLLYYKVAGINAVVAQVLNLYIMFSILSAFNLTLTLSSIAGMILTIGMAVDANVIIFERIKEERAEGKSRAHSISAGFDGAFWAIMDSNITTFIAALFLSQLGSASIQGFAVSLAIGVISSVFTALFVSRLIFDFSTDVLKRQNVSISWRIK